MKGSHNFASLTVPVFDVRSFYGSRSNDSITHDSELFIAMCAQTPRYESEIPVGSLVGVFCTANKLCHSHGHTGKHSALEFNLVGVAMLATPCGEETSD